MKYLTEYRDGEKARKLADEISRIVTRPWAIMEVCGGQTHSIIRNGIDQILPKEIDMIHGPAPLDQMVAAILTACPEVHVLRDPTRGGLAASLNEIAMASALGIVVQETSLPIKTTVRSACEILGLDPLLVANEGKLVCFVPADNAEDVLAAMKSSPFGTDSTIIGRVVQEHPKMVIAKTALGASRVITIPIGEQLPRIC